jgi:hypothetical protein
VDAVFICWPESLSAKLFVFIFLFFVLQNDHDDDSAHEEDPHDLINDNAADSLPQASDNTSEAIDSALKDLTPRYHDKLINGACNYLA